MDKVISSQLYELDARLFKQKVILFTLSTVHKTCPPDRRKLKLKIIFDLDKLILTIESSLISPLYTIYFSNIKLWRTTRFLIPLVLLIPRQENSFEHYNHRFPVKLHEDTNFLNYIRVYRKLSKFVIFCVSFKIHLVNIYTNLYL